MFEQLRVEYGLIFLGGVGSRIEALTPNKEYEAVRMMFTSQKPERVGKTTLYFLVSLLFVLTGCNPEVEVPIDSDQAWVESFTQGTPDPNTPFPESEFAQAKQLKNERKLYTAEKLLLDKIEQAKSSARGQTELGRYCVRLANVLHEEGKDVEAVKYGEIAVRIFYAQRMERRPITTAFINIHTILGLSYERMRRYADAEKHLLKALSLASSAPRAEVSDMWLALLYNRLAEVYKAQKKMDQAKKVQETFKNLKR